MSEGILTAAEIAEIKRLDAARTPGGWTARGGSVDVDGLYEILVLDEDLDDPDPDAAFIAGCSVAVPKLLASIQALRRLLEDSLAVDELKSLLAEAAEWGHKMNCWRTPCTCGYDNWMVKVKKINDS